MLWLHLNESGEAFCRRETSAQCAIETTNNETTNNETTNNETTNNAAEQPV